MGPQSEEAGEAQWRPGWQSSQPRKRNVRTSLKRRTTWGAEQSGWEGQQFEMCPRGSFIVMLLSTDQNRQLQVSVLTQGV